MSDDERVQAMARLYVEEGLTYEEIAAEYGLTRQRVGQLLGPLKLEPERAARRTAERAQRFTAMARRIEAGEVTFQQAADELGYATHSSLRTAMHGVGVKPRVPRPGPAEHGTLNRYLDGCRCDECREANRVYHASLKDREPPEHGTLSGYRNYGCRCQACKEASRLHNREQRRLERNRKERTE